MKLGCVLTFREDRTQEEIVRALNSISHVLDLPSTTYGTEATGQLNEYKQKIVRSVQRPFRMADLLHQYDPSYGGPVWYVP